MKLKPSPHVILTRRTIVVAVVSFFAVVAVGVLGWVTVRAKATDADTKGARALAAAVRVQNVLIDRNTAAARANAVTAHVQCLRGNDGRLRIRQSEVDIVTLIANFRLPGATARTPEQDLAVAALQKVIADRASTLLDLADCDKVAPMPPDPTAGELAQLPKPTPIPPLN